MLDFSPVDSGEITQSQLVVGLSRGDLARLTNEMVDAMLDLIANCTDADVTFVPNDPLADDPYATDEADVDLAWTLAHVIVHATASSEEAGAIAASLARGVRHRRIRSRSEVPWRSITTIAQCRHRLEESRRMRLASLEMWPDEPHLENTYKDWRGETGNAIHRFVSGLRHDDSHLEQLADIVRQAKASKSPVAVGD